MVSLEIGSNGPSKICDIGGDLSTHSKPDILFDAHYLPFRSKVFSFLFASHVFEHLKKPNSATFEALRVSTCVKIILPNSFHPMTWYYPVLPAHYINPHTHLFICNRYVKVPYLLMISLSVFRLMIQKPIFRHIWKKFFDMKYRDIVIEYNS